MYSGGYADLVVRGPANCHQRWGHVMSVAPIVRSAGESKRAARVDCESLDRGSRRMALALRRSGLRRGLVGSPHLLLGAQSSLGLGAQ